MKIVKIENLKKLCQDLALLDDNYESLEEYDDFINQVRADTLITGDLKKAEAKFEERYNEALLDLLGEVEDITEDIPEPKQGKYIEDRIKAAWGYIKRWVDDLITGFDSEDDKEFDAFLDRMVAVRTGEAPKFDGAWIPCDYKQPPVPGTYLTTTRNGAVRTNHYYGLNKWGYRNDAVAWRPLPAAWGIEK